MMINIELSVSHEYFPSVNRYIVRPTSGEDQNINKVINQFLGRLIPKPYPVGEHM